MPVRRPRRSPTPAPALLSPGQIFCPVGRAMDVIGDRWTLVLVRQLLSRPLGFQELRVRTGIAPRVLSGRLRQLVGDGFIESTPHGARAGYRLTDKGAALEPIVTAIARWYLRHGLDHLNVDAGRFSATSARSILESLPHLLREERVQGVRLTFEIRLSGLGGGVWTVALRDGACEVSQGFADHADVRYTADARIWCGVALGILDPRDVYRNGEMSKDGGREALDFYFHQISRTQPERGRAARPGAGSRSKPKKERSAA